MKESSWKTIGRATEPDKKLPSHSVIQKLLDYRKLDAHQVFDYTPRDMRQEALTLAQHLLEDPCPAPEIFIEAVRTFHQWHTRLKSLRPLVEGAYRRMKKKGQRKARLSMLAYYYSLEDTEKALSYATLRPQNGFDYLLSFSIFQNQGQKEKADRLFQMGLKMLSKYGIPCLTVILPFLAEYCAERGNLDAACRIWRQIPSTPIEYPLVLAKHEYIVLNRAEAALQTLRESLAEITVLEQQGDPQLAASHPGLHSEIAAQIKKRLRKYEQVLEKVMRRKERLQSRVGSINAGWMFWQDQKD